MAQQNVEQIRPFVTKQIFEQVSAVMWGQNALDYHNNYIIPRAHWSDSDIREEARYFAGLAQGLRLAASREQSRPMMPQGPNQGAPVFWNHFSIPALYRDASSVTAPPLPGLPQFQPPYHPGMDLGLDVPPTCFNSPSVPPFISSPPPHCMGSGAHQSWSLDVESQANVGSNVQQFGAPYGYPFPVGPAAAKGKGRTVALPVEVPPTPLGKVLSTPLAEGPASQSRANLPVYHTKFQPPAVPREESNTLVPTVEDETEDSSDEEYDRVSVLSAEEDCCIYK